MNRRRELQEKFALLLESSQASVVIGIVELLYQEVVLERTNDRRAGSASAQSSPWWYNPNTSNGDASIRLLDASPTKGRRDRVNFFLLSSEQNS